ncbi:hypothetical protein AK812_SmicGene23919 [Symbiodinium microadriaticum]|uniref:Uncharacterized protein n=1 Tax=Symbiodinium microadriaticum TaxID=2951 RepID=A0A1Q9DG01_SYMMI|nr:hypothetical protein AK812_SmicGene23919 [Symbiodinium microadriaticum]CAE7520734.1 unnamed protein product [Symbiodinium sp. KB8]
MPCGAIAHMAIADQPVLGCPEDFLCRTSQGWFAPDAALLLLPHCDAFQVWPLQLAQSAPPPATLSLLRQNSGSELFAGSLEPTEGAERAYSNDFDGQGVIIARNGLVYVTITAYADQDSIRSSALFAYLGPSGLGIEYGGLTHFARVLPPLPELPAVQFVAGNCDGHAQPSVVDLRAVQGSLHVCCTEPDATPAQRIEAAIQGFGGPDPANPVIARIGQGLLQVLHREQAVSPFVPLIDMLCLPATTGCVRMKCSLQQLILASCDSEFRVDTPSVVSRSMLLELVFLSSAYQDLRSSWVSIMREPGCLAGVQVAVQTLPSHWPIQVNRDSGPAELERMLNAAGHHPDHGLFVAFDTLTTSVDLLSANAVTCSPEVAALRRLPQGLVLTEAAIGTLAVIASGGRAAVVAVPPGHLDWARQVNEVVAQVETLTLRLETAGILPASTDPTTAAWEDEQATSGDGTSASWIPVDEARSGSSRVDRHLSPAVGMLIGWHVRQPGLGFLLGCLILVRGDGDECSSEDSPVPPSSPDLTEVQPPTPVAVPPNGGHGVNDVDAIVRPSDSDLARTSIPRVETAFVGAPAFDLATIPALQRRVAAALSEVDTEVFPRPFLPAGCPVVMHNPFTARGWFFPLEARQVNGHSVVIPAFKDQTLWTRDFRIGACLTVRLWFPHLRQPILTWLRDGEHWDSDALTFRPHFAARYSGRWVPVPWAPGRTTHLVQASDAPNRVATLINASDGVRGMFLVPQLTGCEIADVLHTSSTAVCVLGLPATLPTAQLALRDGDVVWDSLLYGEPEIGWATLEEEVSGVSLVGLAALMSRHSVALACLTGLVWSNGVAAMRRSTSSERSRSRSPSPLSSAPWIGRWRPDAGAPFEHVTHQGHVDYRVLCPFRGWSPFYYVRPSAPADDLLNAVTDFTGNWPTGCTLVGRVGVLLQEEDRPARWMVLPPVDRELARADLDITREAVDWRNGDVLLAWEWHDSTTSLTAPMLSNIELVRHAALWMADFEVDFPLSVVLWRPGHRPMVITLPLPIQWSAAACTFVGRFATRFPGRWVPVPWAPWPPTTSPPRPDSVHLCLCASDDSQCNIILESCTPYGTHDQLDGRCCTVHQASTRESLRRAFALPSDDIRLLGVPNQEDPFPPLRDGDIVHYTTSGAWKQSQSLSAWLVLSLFAWHWSPMTILSSIWLLCPLHVQAAPSEAHHWLWSPYQGRLGPALTSSDQSVESQLLRYEPIWRHGPRPISSRFWF